MSTRRLAIYHLGRIGYTEALALQERLAEAREAQEIDDTLLLLEHDPVITLGRGTKQGNVLASQEMLAAQGVALHETGRGGDVTYHGPGQLVGYPIVDLNPDRRDVRRYVNMLEETMIRMAATYDLQASRIPGLNGTWIDNRKLGAVGVRIRRWITMHGFAFNVTTRLQAFELIVPCGIPDKQVTSLEHELKRDVTLDEVQTLTGRVFSEVFGYEPMLREGRP